MGKSPANLFQPVNYLPTPQCRLRQHDQIKRQKRIQTLNEVVAIATCFAKSTNVERDRDNPSVLDGYVPTSRTEALLSSVLQRATNGDAGVLGR